MADRRQRLTEATLRFVFGGLVTAATGYVAHRAGAPIGGLFLAFPAILPASLTLVKKHDGRALAVADARGARYGSVGMLGFGAAVWLAPSSWAFGAVLALATLVWLALAAALWWLAEGRG